MTMTKFLARRLPAPLQHSCPTCEVEPAQPCINRSTGKPAAQTHRTRINQICSARFLVDGAGVDLWLRDVEQDRRMGCSKLKGHRGKHRNPTHDLFWSTPVVVDLEPEYKES